MNGEIGGESSSPPARLSQTHLASLEHLRLFDPDVMDIPQLGAPTTRFLLRLLVTAYILDPRGAGCLLDYAWCIPCEICYGTPRRWADMHASIVAVERGCFYLEARISQYRKYHGAITSVHRDIRVMKKYFENRGFHEPAYDEQRCAPAVRDAVTMLRHQLDMSTRLLLEELLAHRPELLQAGVLDSLSLWWDKWRAGPLER